MKKSVSIELEVTELEGGLIYLLDRQIEKVDHTSLAEGIQVLKDRLGASDSRRGHLLLTGIIEALVDPDSFWKLTLSHRSKGEAISTLEKSKRFSRDAAIAMYVESLTDEGYSKESACILAETEFGLSISGIKAAIARVEKRKL